MVTKEQIEAAEKKQADYLERIQEIDKILSGLTPADPRRLPLKAEKADTLPRYRGAKSHAKTLRRTWNSHPDSLRQGEATEVVAKLIRDHNAQEEDEVEDVDSEELLGKLYGVLVAINDRIHFDISGAEEDGLEANEDEDDGLGYTAMIDIEADEQEPIQDFVDWWEHTHNIES